MSRLFANGTEGNAWEAVWCSLCTEDTDDDFEDDEEFDDEIGGPLGIARDRQEDFG